MDFSNFDMGSFQNQPLTPPPPTQQMYAQGAPQMTMPPPGPSFQQAPAGYAADPNGLMMPNAAAMTGLNQVYANSIAAANAPKSVWAQGQDFSNSLFGNIIAPFAAGMGAPGALDAAQTFKDSILSDKKQRDEALKANIDQIKNISSVFDNLNQRQIAELGRKTAETNAQRMLQDSEIRRQTAMINAHSLEQQRLATAAAATRNAETNATKAATGQQNANTKTDTLTEKKKLTPSTIKKNEALAKKNDAQADETPLMGAAKRQYMTEGMADKQKRTGIYGTAVDNRNTHNQATEAIGARNAATNEKKAATQSQVAQNRIDNPTGKGAVAQRLLQVLGGPQQTAQAAPQAVPQGADPKEALRQIYRQVGGDRTKFYEEAHKRGLKI